MGIIWSKNFNAQIVTWTISKQSSTPIVVIGEERAELAVIGKIRRTITTTGRILIITIYQLKSYL